jgi:hypothetical protein
MAIIRKKENISSKKTAVFLEREILDVTRTKTARIKLIPPENASSTSRFSLK